MLYHTSDPFFRKAISISPCITFTLCIFYILILNGLMIILDFKNRRIKRNHLFLVDFIIILAFSFTTIMFASFYCQKKYMDGYIMMFERYKSDYYNSDDVIKLVEKLDLNNISGEQYLAIITRYIKQKTIHAASILIALSLPCIFCNLFYIYYLYNIEKVLDFESSLSCDESSYRYG
ncbi:hypothetical protein TRFO_04317 [Tritrichomonas foetus]|uniref:Uncharacterized protein n=1 Tax=Tritrichomonas foetus TaxID=1144522 RepID=A0A1J4KGV9_9EUKA|nr:hypothetical protein TRFO_04317 [Tritrichomonas foetus]|eukprot:OHT10282.1 hypothetical protein TRFO_04317 [Tritrichomonas foetus]